MLFLRGGPRECSCSPQDVEMVLCTCWIQNLVLSFAPCLCPVALRSQKWTRNDALAAPCYEINDGAVCKELGKAMRDPDTHPFPLRMKEPYPAHGMNECNSFRREFIHDVSHDTC